MPKGMLKPWENNWRPDPGVEEALPESKRPPSMDGSECRGEFTIVPEHCDAPVYYDGAGVSATVPEMHRFGDHFQNESVGVSGIYPFIAFSKRV